MAVTKGHGNPDWSRDETILALDLHFRMNGVTPSPQHPQVIALSQELRGLAIHGIAARRSSFRNPAGVAFKLQNLRAEGSGSGLTHSSKVDGAVWKEFGQRPEVVAVIASAIRRELSEESITREEIVQTLTFSDEEFSEGRVLTAAHIVRERSRTLRFRVIGDRLKRGELSCDCCREGPKLPQTDMAAACFEVHHLRPLFATNGEVKTRLSDVALVCAVCHRLIHKMIEMQKRWITIEELAAEIGEPLR